MRILRIGLVDDGDLRPPAAACEHGHLLPVQRLRLHVRVEPHARLGRREVAVPRVEVDRVRERRPVDRAVEVRRLPECRDRDVDRRACHPASARARRRGDRERSERRRRVTHDPCVAAPRSPHAGRASRRSATTSRDSCRTCTCVASGIVGRVLCAVVPAATRARRRRSPPCRGRPRRRAARTAPSASGGDVLALDCLPSARPAPRRAVRAARGTASS